MFETLLQPNDILERCGVFFANGEVLELPNISPTPEQGYEIDPIAVLPHLEKATGTWHTHPTGPAGFSGEDYKGFLLWPKMEHVVISPGGVKRYRVENGVIFECA